MIEHGIQTERSDIRVHVCPKERRVYIFPTKSGVDAVNNYPVVKARQGGIVTAEGCWVPPMDIKKCVWVGLRDPVWDAMCFRGTDSLGEKGRKAERLVLGMIRSGVFPGASQGTGVTDAGLQIEGQDIIIDGERVVQVKCDYAGGRNGLFLQLRERNPLKIR